MTLGACDELLELTHKALRRPYKSIARPLFSLDNRVLAALVEPLLESNMRGFSVRLFVALACLVAFVWLLLRVFVF
jgi:hypothetical protein